MLTRYILTIEVMDNVEDDKALQERLRNQRGREELIIDAVQIAVRKWLLKHDRNPTGWIEVFVEEEI